ncbi:hypothetical protein HYH03_008183 [Edaphochlamys debaryana]|uniref:Uncharacterized protein n=1 Tax=Edaphochlamys debaryana TaxID=47281 RepID=A0A835Y9U2_9CHLO|nr:hypothetical protein HYH03_008183 [Edaphochlamys debaryana]|eukprot:KAG2493669.1 hypothetical protein HYH03_008183 [Edaphochlamys debaryana]
MSLKPPAPRESDNGKDDVETGPPSKSPSRHQVAPAAVGLSLGQGLEEKPVANDKELTYQLSTHRQLIVRGAGFRKNFAAFFNGPYFEIIPPEYEKVAAQRYGGTKEGSKCVMRSACGGQSFRSAPSHAEDGMSTEATTPKAAPTNAEGASPPFPDFLTKLKSVVVNDYETDLGEWKRRQQQDPDTAPPAEPYKYEILPNMLVPIPFDAPKVLPMLVECFATIFIIIQATVVMFIAIMDENQDRTYKDKGNYNGTWLPLIKALVYLYPLCTLVIMAIQALEITIKKFMYYRLLSLRLLLDWENAQVWQGTFFYYFVATWIMLNCWAIYGLVAYSNQYGNSGVDPTSRNAFIVVNLQTIQLLIQYYRVMTAERRLVSLNEIFERAPVEAQSLLQYTYIVEEEDVIEECYQFLRAHYKRLMRRFGYILTFGCTNRDWAVGHKMDRFDIYTLRAVAGNSDVAMKEELDLLREQWKAQGRNEDLADLDVYVSEMREIQEAEEAEELNRLRSTTGPNPVLPGMPSQPPAAQQMQGHAAGPEARAGAAVSPNDVALTDAKQSNGAGPKHDESPQEKTSEQAVDVAATPNGNAANGGTGHDGAAEAEARVPSPNGGGSGLEDGSPDRPSNRGPRAREVAQDMMHTFAHPSTMSRRAQAQLEDDTPPRCCSRRWWRAKWRGFWWHMYVRIYASTHSLLVAFLPGANSWPFRPDKAYFRFLTALQLITMACCCLIVLFGIFGATNSNPCKKGNKACQQCFTYNENFLSPNSTGYNDLKNKGKEQCDASNLVTTCPLFGQLGDLTLNTKWPVFGWTCAAAPPPPP